jgi:hypothetical protein
MVFELARNFSELFGSGSGVVRQVHEQLVAESTFPAKDRVPQRKGRSKPAE